MLLPGWWLKIGLTGVEPKGVMRDAGCEGNNVPNPGVIGDSTLVGKCFSEVLWLVLVCSLYMTVAETMTTSARIVERAMIVADMMRQRGRSGYKSSNVGR